MAISYLSAKQIQGLSSDTKPTNVNDDSTFRETDTGNIWYMIAGTWTEKPIRNIGSDYDVYLHGSIIKARNNRTGLVKYTHASDVGAITNTIIADFLTTGAKIRYSNDNFTTNTPIVIPTADAGSSRAWHFEGYNPSNARDKATQFKVGSSFPDQDYMFKCVAVDTSNQNASIKINGFFLNNRDFAKDGNGTTNILGGATRIDAGFLKYESDKTTAVGGGSPCHIENVTWHYLWRGIHLLGYVYWPVIWNCGGWDANAHFVGDFDLKLERSSNLGTTQHGPTVDLKGLDLRNFKTTHVAGKSSESGRGSMNNGVVFFGGYHNISHVYLNGQKYNDAVFAFKQCFSSVFDDLGCIDLDATQGAGFKAVFLFDTTDPTGNAAYSTYSTYNNLLRKLAGYHANNSFKFENSPFRNRIETYAYWGQNMVINDAGAGIENVIELIEGQQQAATVNSKITSSNSLVKIIDKRAGASNRGIYTTNGTASQTAFNIPHGCFTTPVDYDARPISTDAFGTYTLSAGTANITVTYDFPPPGGTNNLKWKWIAEVYA